ncbi:MAG: alpha/beta fold hydrolase [Prolixibacteraceae bacterium]
MKTSGPFQFNFPIGYEKFHKSQLFNFQLNRPYALGYARFEDLKSAGTRINSFKDWKREMLFQAKKAYSEERLLNAAFYFRAAEFYIKSTDPEKNILYSKFTDLFYQVFSKDGIEKYSVPYNGTLLPAIKIKSASEKKGTIVIHGGFDSFMEEFYSMMRYFSNHGYEVIGFEGPGQGAALRRNGLPISYEWEKPVKAVLDYFDLDDVTLLGLSMGGWLCLRAAAFESRINRVIANGHAIDYMKSMPSFMRIIHLWFMTHFRSSMNKMAEWKFERREGMASWMVDQLKFITQKSKPLDAMGLYLDLNDRNIKSELVKQDVLILSGSKDHFVPSKMHDMQLKALVNAKSVTGRIFTESDQAQNHCQIGNIELSLRTMLEWIEQKSGRN